MPEKPTLDGLEEQWVAPLGRPTAPTASTGRRAAAPREEIYSIDTPPPTRQRLAAHRARLHLHAHRPRRPLPADARQAGLLPDGLGRQRAADRAPGAELLRRALRPVAALRPDVRRRREKPAARTSCPVSRRNFVELCERLTAEDEERLRAALAPARAVGRLDATSTRRSSERSRATAQRAFLRNLARGEAYRAEAPTLWDVDFRTAVAQAELEDRERPGAYHRLAFHGPTAPVLIETTRPELLPACVALVAHPDDERYQPLFGTTVRTPLFDVEVPVVAHRLAEPDKGTGIAMICTFGDITDVTWWRELQLPTRPIIGRDGRLLADPPPGVRRAPRTRSWPARP